MEYGKNDELPTSLLLFHFSFPCSEVAICNIVNYPMKRPTWGVAKIISPTACEDLSKASFSQEGTWKKKLEEASDEKQACVTP